MARSKVLGFLLLVFFSMVLLSVAVIQGCRAKRAMLRHSIFARREQWFQVFISMTGIMGTPETPNNNTNDGEEDEVPVSLDLLRIMMADFARERDWDRYHSPRNLLLALVGEVGELSEIFQWKGEVPRGLPGWKDEEKVHLGEELSDVLLYLVRLADICGVDLGKAALRKVRLNAIKYPVKKGSHEADGQGTDESA